MRTKTNIFLTNLQPECGADATSFLSAVYKRGTQAKKRQADVPQCGRSMIEMLGVLAIIGVLTVGSITAYSKAMRRHLLNKQREQYSYILSAAETNHDKININTPSLPTDFISILKTFGWIPEEMIQDDSMYVYDVFKNQIRFFKWPSNMGLIVYLETPNAYEQCTNLYQTIKQYHAFLWSTFVGKKNDGSSNYGNHHFGDQMPSCINHQEMCIRNLTLSQISQLCQVCNDTEDNYCVLHIVWQ